MSTIAGFSLPAYSGSPISLDYVFSGLTVAPIITTKVYRNRNSITPLGSSYNPTITVVEDTIEGQYRVVVGYETTERLPDITYLEVFKDGVIFNAGDIFINRSTEGGGPYTVFVNQITLFGNGANVLLGAAAQAAISAAAAQAALTEIQGELDNILLYVGTDENGIATLVMGSSSNVEYDNESHLPAVILTIN